MTDIRPSLLRTDAEMMALFRTMRTTSDVADLLELPDGYLKRILRTRRERANYTMFMLPKKGGGERSIAVPPKNLSILQKKLNRVLQLVYRPKPAVHGYRHRRSIKTNAMQHVGRRWVLNVDLEDFFPSIHFGRIRGALIANPFRLPRDAATVIAQICTMADGILPQGAPTSPFVSNIVCSRLDGQMMALAKKHSMTYTRYCDDISLSCDHSIFPPAIASGTGGWLGTNVMIGEALQSVIVSNGFRINSQKSRLQFRDTHQEVTGVVVNKMPNVAWSYIRSLRALLFMWRRHGLTTTANRYAATNNLFFDDVTAMERHLVAVLRGRIDYVGYIRGKTDPVYCGLRDRLHICAPDLISPTIDVGRHRVGVPFATPARWQRLFESRGASVVPLEVRANGDTMLGTAFAIDGETLVTAAHNLNGEVRVLIGLESFAVSGCLLHQLGAVEVDAALVLISHGRSGIQVDRRLPETGEPIAIIGYASIPLRHPEVGIYTGVVESVRDSYSRTTKLIQVSVPSSGGLSGSPVLDSRGRAIGIVIESTYEHTADGVPAREYCTVLPIKYALAISRCATGTRF